MFLSLRRERVKDKIKDNSQHCKKWKTKSMCLFSPEQTPKPPVRLAHLSTLKGSSKQVYVSI